MTQAAKNSHNSLAESSRDFSTCINEILRGRINSVGTFTALNGTTSTVVVDPNAHPASVAVATALGAPLAIGVSSRGLGTLTFSHADPGSDRAVAYVLLG